MAAGYDSFNRLTLVEDLRYDPLGGSLSPQYARYAYDSRGRRILTLYSGQVNDGYVADAWPDEYLAYSGLAAVEKYTWSAGGGEFVLNRRFFYDDAINRPVLVEADADSYGDAGYGDVDDAGDYAFIPVLDDRGTLMGVVTGKTVTVDGVGYLPGDVLERLYYNSTGLARAYDASGNLSGVNPYRSSYVDIGWCGMRRSRFTGLYHTHFRDYTAIHGRWLSEDPAGYADGLNLYHNYAGINGVDVLGLAGYFFDGTNNIPASKTNIHRLHVSYDAISFYAYGIGSGYYADGTPYSGSPADIEVRIIYEQVTGYTLENRAEWMKRNLETQLAAGDNVVDLFGFSRGAATAFYFLHLIKSEIDKGNPLYKNIELRTTVLFDPVPTDIGLVEQVDSIKDDAISHALGSNEDVYSRHANDYPYYIPEGLTFTNRPLVLIALDEQRAQFHQSNTKRATVVGFRGVHSDIGGGYEGFFEFITREFVYDKYSGLFDLPVHRSFPLDAKWRPGYEYILQNRCHPWKELIAGQPVLSMKPTNNAKCYFSNGIQRHFDPGMILHPSVTWFGPLPSDLGITNPFISRQCGQ